MRLIILAAGQGTRLKPLTDNKPKCLTPLLNKPLLQWQIEVAHDVGIKDIVVVGGYQIEQLEEYPVTLVCNHQYMTTNMVYSLLCAKEYLQGDLIISYGDIIFEASVLNKLIKTTYDITVVIDSLWREYWEMRFENPLSDAECLDCFEDGRINKIGQKVKSLGEINGQYIGLSCYRRNSISKLIQTYETLSYNNIDAKKVHNLYMTDLIQEMINLNIDVYSLPIQRGWFEIDNLRDLEVAESLLQLDNLVIENA